MAIGPAQFPVLLTLPSPLGGAQGPSCHPRHKDDTPFSQPGTGSDVLEAGHKPPGAEAQGLPCFVFKQRRIMERHKLFQNNVNGKKIIREF